MLSKLSLLNNHIQPEPTFFVQRLSDGFPFEKVGDLKGKTIFITGASRGIGLAIGIKAAKDGANVAIAAKTVTPHPKLGGTIYTAA